MPINMDSNSSGFNSDIVKKWDEMDEAERLLACERMYGAIEALLQMNIINKDIYMYAVYHPKMDASSYTTRRWEWEIGDKNWQRLVEDTAYDKEYEPLYKKSNRQKASDRERRNNGAGCGCGWRGWKSREPKF